MEPVDTAYDTLNALRDRIAEFDATLVSEADVRSKVIDPIFTHVLGWQPREYLCEDATGDGYIDYVFQVNGRSRLVVEAKRDGRSLGCDGREPGRAFVLDGSVFRDEAAREGIRQAIRYCGLKNAELACVTNGREWIIFRGNRLGDGSDTTKGLAFVFPSLEAVLEKFKTFHALLARDDVERHEFRAYFQEVEGRPIRSSNFSRALRDPRSAHLLATSSLAVDVDRTMRTFFDRLTGDDDPDLLTECFVETGESQHADRRLARISEDILHKIRDLDTSDSAALVEVIERATQAKRHEFVVIVGTKGAGKTTFIQRFFSRVLRPELAEECISCRINLADSSGDGRLVVSWLDQQLLSSLEDALFAGDPPDFNELEGIFYDDYTRLRKGPWNRLYESDHNAFQIKFGDRVESMRENKPNEYIRGLIRHTVNSRKKLPVIVFDNADHFHISFQEQVYQYARSIYESALCLIILPITDRTSWQLSRHGALQSFEHEALYLPTPPTEQVIRRRIDFMQARLETSRVRPEDRYFVKLGISLSLKDLNAFTQSLQRVFLQTDETARWIGNLSNNDVRRSLKLARQFVTSGHLEVEDLLRAHMAGTTKQVSKTRAAKAIMRGNYDIYGGQQEFVQNIYAMRDDIDASPLLGLSILQLLDDAPEDQSLGHMLELSQIVQYLEAMGYDSRTVEVWTDALLQSALCQDYDPTVTDIAAASRLEITPAGKQHLYWCRSNFEFISTMADVTPVRDRETYDRLREAIAQGGGGWKAKAACFVDYMLDEDANYCGVPDHPAYRGQRRARDALAAAGRRLVEEPAWR